MIELSQDFAHESVIGVGHHRVCFIHPQDSRLCIKVVYNHCDTADQELARELKYYAHLQRTLRDWRGLAKFRGKVETNLGVGYVYDRILDFDMSSSKTLEQYFTLNNIQRTAEEMQIVLTKLKQYLSENKVVTMSIKPYNILCQRVSESEVFPVICDNIGSATLIPLEMYSSWFYRQKLERIWNRFEKDPLVQAMYEVLRKKNLSKSK